MKRVYLITAATCAVMLLLFLGFFYLFHPFAALENIRVGFIYNNDDSAPYSYNFSIAQDALEKEYGDRMEIFTCNNVREDFTVAPLRELAGKGCDIIFINNYSAQVVDVAREYPQITFCQTSYQSGMPEDAPDNYHTFKGEAYQCRYVSGIAAGLKLREMIDQGLLSPDQAQVGFLAAYPTDEVISGYTAFLLGVRSVVPEAGMRVAYTNTWSSYSAELACARRLIEEGCVILSQHTDTIGPAVACQEAAANQPVYFISYNQSMIDVAPSSYLTGCRVNWTPYVSGAVNAVMTQKEIEKTVSGSVHGRDMSAGFEEDWVAILEINPRLAVPGTQEKLNKAIDQFRKGKKTVVFKGDYVGVNPDDPQDTCSLKEGYIENEHSSFPTFGYIIDGIIIE